MTTHDESVWQRIANINGCEFLGFQQMDAVPMFQDHQTQIIFMKLPGETIGQAVERVRERARNANSNK